MRMKTKLKTNEQPSEQKYERYDQHKLAQWFLLILFACLSPFSFAEDNEQNLADKGWDEYTLGNLINGMALLEQAAEQGDAAGQARLGYIFDKAGKTDQAFELFEKSAKQNNAEGQFGLSKMYSSGRGVEKDLTRAGDLMRQSAEQGYLLAMRVYGLALETGGLNLTPNPSLAFDWIQRAAEKGDGTAMRKLREVYLRGELGQEVNLERAKYWLDQLNTPIVKSEATKATQ